MKILIELLMQTMILSNVNIVQLQIHINTNPNLVCPGVKRHQYDLVRTCLCKFQTFSELFHLSRHVHQRLRYKHLHLSLRHQHHPLLH